MLPRMRRRDCLLLPWTLPWTLPLAALPAWSAAPGLGVRQRTLQFPADFGAHPDTRIEWWYATGWLKAAGAAAEAAPAFGFQITFFRSRTGVAAEHPSRFAATQLIFAHAALTDLAQRRLRHDQRIARAGFDIAGADAGDTRVHLRDWRLARSGPPELSSYGMRAHSKNDSDSAGFGFDFTLTTTQPLLLQGTAGFSRKGPAPEQASHYYSQPQLNVAGTLQLDGRAQPVQGRAWLDHEWSNSLLAPQAVGWDWIGMNLADGGALTAFRLRTAEGSSLYAGGSFRAPGAATRNFGPDEVRMTPGRTWASTASRGVYPVEWRIDTPVGSFSVKALLDDQELDSRAGTGTTYWEGLSELREGRDNGSGRLLGHGYLEMTGYSGRLKL